MLSLYKDVLKTYNLLADYKPLCQPQVEMDVINLLTWRGNDNPRTVIMQYLYQMPHVNVLYGLRGISDAKISWKRCEGLAGMQFWANYMIGLWSLSRNSQPAHSVQVVDDEAEWSEDALVGTVQWLASRH